MLDFVCARAVVTEWQNAGLFCSPAKPSGQVPN